MKTIFFTISLLVAATFADRTDNEVYTVLDQPFRSDAPAQYWLASAFGVPINNNDLRLSHHGDGKFTLTDGQQCNISYSVELSSSRKRGFSVTDYESPEGNACGENYAIIRSEFKGLEDSLDGYILGVNAFHEHWLAKGVYNNSSDDVDILLFQQVREGHYRLDGKKIQMGEYIQQMVDNSVRVASLDGPSISPMPVSVDQVVTDTGVPASMP